MGNDELLAYYEQKQEELRTYLANELKKFKDANNNYLSTVIADACEHAKNLLEISNQKAFDRFSKSKEDIEDKIKENYPATLLAHIIKAAENDLEGSLRFNQTIFENSMAYYKSLLKN